MERLHNPIVRRESPAKIRASGRDGAVASKRSNLLLKSAHGIDDMKCIVYCCRVTSWKDVLLREPRMEISAPVPEPPPHPSAFSTIP